jgi:hypothetical protein
LRWAERELTEGMADQHHNPSIKSCLFRVPGTINTKAKAAGLDPIVKFIQVGDWTIFGNSFPGLPLTEVNKDFLMKFHSSLVQKVIDDKVEKLQHRRRHLAQVSNILLVNGNNSSSSIPWIDKLLQAPVEDGRKNLLYWVLAPYLITVKGLDYDKSYSVLETWLDRCDDVSRLEPDWTSFRYRIRYCLDTAEDQERKPIRFETFKEYYPELYRRLFVKE